jgi:hypothetical protein
MTPSFTEKLVANSSDPTIAMLAKYPTDIAAPSRQLRSSALLWE